MLGQDGLVPPLDPREASGIITGSELVLKNYACAPSLNAKDIKRLIADVLHNQNFKFNADDVDTGMLEPFANSIDSCDLEIISMHQEGDGAQKLELFNRPAEKVLRELVSDIRLAGCSRSTWILMETLFAFYSNGSVSFHMYICISYTIWYNK